MKPAAIGVRAHSGWCALVAIALSADAPEILRRERVVLIDPSQPGAKQPYHFAEQLPLAKAEKYIAGCTAASGGVAHAAVESILLDLRRRGYRVDGCALLLASGRALPALPGILVSHALIHTAEGQFFRDTVRGAFEQPGIAVTGFYERDLEKRADVVFGDAALRVLRKISELGRVVGPPWTADEKIATLAAWMLMESRSTLERRDRR